MLQVWHLKTLQVTGKRSEGKESADFQGGEYEAAVNQEKRDDCRSHVGQGVGGGLSEESDSGGEQEEVSVAALNVRKSPWGQRSWWCWSASLCLITLLLKWWR